LYFSALPITLHFESTDTTLNITAMFVCIAAGLQRKGKKERYKGNGVGQKERQDDGKGRKKKKNGKRRFVR
jgi:hypothetical protein